ncbi:hypothetical protein HOY80DRAFT_296831 [Tuber brumale]|nr:hypothetical protein HOY80DRAFT_296831 [Tuber brumale]
MIKVFSGISGEGETDRISRGEKARGRDEGRKREENKICSDHPGKVLIHASDYKKHMNQQHRPFRCISY